MATWEEREVIVLNPKLGCKAQRFVEAREGGDKSAGTTRETAASNREVVR